MRTTPQTHQNDKGRCVSQIQRPLIWCGEGDLNPHEITADSCESNQDSCLKEITIPG
jgi:hypothetical protein